MHHLIFGLNDSVRINRAWLYQEPKVSVLQARVLDLESEVMTSPGSIPTGVTFFHWIPLFSRSKASATNISIISKQ